jgi:hypothetical protein
MTYRVDSPGVETTWWANEDAAMAEAGRLVRETNARHAVVWQMSEGGREDATK